MLNRESFACAPWFPPNQTNAKPGLSSVRSYVEDVGGGNESWTLGESWERYPSRSGIHYCCKFNASWKPGSDTRLALRFGYVANVTGRKPGSDTRLAPRFRVYTSVNTATIRCISGNLELYCAFDWEFWRSARVVKKLWGADLRIY